MNLSSIQLPPDLYRLFALHTTAKVYATLTLQNKKLRAIYSQKRFSQCIHIRYRRLQQNSDNMNGLYYRYALPDGRFDGPEHCWLQCDPVLLYSRNWRRGLRHGLEENWKYVGDKQSKVEFYYEGNLVFKRKWTIDGEIWS